MSEIYELVGHPPLHNPVMVVALEGWIDAGMAAAGAMTTLLEELDTEVVALFDTDELLDQRARRPLMSLNEGHVRSLTWPSIELRAGVDRSGRHVLMLAGAEPDHGWQKFCNGVTDLIGEFDVQMVVGLGAYPAPVPHTRPTGLALTSPSEPILETHTGFFRGTIDVPAGVQSAIEVAAHEEGHASIGLWAQVPHYLSGMSYPAGSKALLDGLRTVAGLDIPFGDLDSQVAETRDRVDRLVASDPAHETMVQQLEENYDEYAQNLGLDALGPLPTADELADEFQQFLREQGE
jgi:proteasome assembly chaperone (PAC2) family protein